MDKLRGKTALITGGNSGIGLATAQALKAEEARVVILGRDQATLATATARIGDDTVIVQGDVANLVDIDRLVTTTKETVGRVDILFINLHML